MKKTKILVLGASGMLGNSMVPQLREKGYEVVTQSRGKGYDAIFDQTNSEEWKFNLDKIEPDFIINLAAITNVDYCEINPIEALEGNVVPLYALKTALKGKKSKPFIIHISTDQLYEGKGPHSENSTNPINIYAITKRSAELILLKDNACMIRTNFFGKSLTGRRTSFSDWIIRELKDGNQIKLFHDVLFNPLHIDTLISIIIDIIKIKPKGIYNIGSRGGKSKAEFGLELCKQLNLNKRLITSTSVETASLIARRPRDMRMNIEKIEELLGKKMPMLDLEIEKVSKDDRQTNE